MDENTPIKYSDLLQPDDSFEHLLDLLEQVGAKYSALQQSIKSSAEAIKSSLSGVNGTTAQGQAVISDATKQANELAKKERELAATYSETSKAILAKTNELKRAQRVAKLEQKIAETQEGSYDRLSAQYDLNKMRLNAMTQAERENTKEGQALVQETANIYKQMKMLQEVTGKHTLSVGEYGIATVNLAADIRRAVQALTQMRLEGQEGTEQYNRLVQDLKKLKTQYSIVKTETQSLGSQTSRLNQVMGALTSTSGALAAMTGLVDDADSSWGQSLLRINKLIAITNGLMAFTNGLYKQSYVTNLLMNAAKKAEIRARAINIARLKGETSNTILLTAAQKAFNIVAKANPIFLLGSVIVAVAAGIALFTSNTKKAKSQVEAFNKSAEGMRNVLQAIAGIANTIPELTIDSWRRAIDIYEEIGNSEAEIMLAEQEIFNERTTMYENDLEMYSDYVDNLDDYAEEEKNIALALREWRKHIFEEYTSKGLDVGEGTFHTTFTDVGHQIPAFPLAGIVEGMSFKTDEVEEILQNALDNMHANVEIGLRVTAEGVDLQKDMQIFAEKVWKTQEAINRETEEQDARLIGERFAQREALIKVQYEAEIRALEHRIASEMELTEEHEAYLRERIEKIKQEMNQALAKTAYERRKANITAARATEDLEMKALKDGFEKRRSLILQSYSREREDIENELKYNGELTRKEREELRKQLVALEFAQAREISDLIHEENQDILSITRATEDMIIDAKAESYAKQLIQLEVQYEREKEDLQDRLDFEALTERQREAIQAQMLAVDKRYASQRLEIEKQLRKALLENDRDLWSNRLEILNKYTQDYLDASLGVIAAEKAIALAEFNDTATNLGLDADQYEAARLAIINKYSDLELTTRKNHMQELFDLEQELAESEFNIVRHSEYRKAQFTRKQEIARLQKILELDKQFGNKLTEQERQIIENRIKALQNQTPSYEDFYDLIGIPSEWKDLLEDLVNQITEAFQEIIDARMELADAQVEAAEKEVNVTKSALDAELEARANGYASNVALARKEFEEAKKREKEALAFKRQVQKEQETIDSLNQVSSLVTATAQFWSTSSALGPIAGPIAAGIATAAMWTAYLFAKIKANQFKNQAAEYGEGHVELLQGGSHASGNDISLGRTRNGKERRAEGGEYLAIINKRNSRKYGRTIEDVINAFNSGTFEREFMRSKTPIEYRAIDEPSTIPEFYSGIRDFSREFGRTSATDISRLESDVSALRKQMESREYVEADGTIVMVKGNTTRRIKHG